MEKNNRPKPNANVAGRSKRQARPRDLALPAEGFARLPQVLHALGICKSSLFMGIKKGIYPKPIRIGTRTSVWLVTDIRETIQKLSATQK